MDKIDILMAILGAAAYVAIMVDLRNYERKMAAFEAVQEKRRKYAELQAERRKAELAMEKSMKQVENTKKRAQMGEDILERVGKA
ncbi:MAG: hypothetical protein SPF17_06035 [Candidatus Mucispirillum faecigallinarum]|nr:hypothetical protein [Mucispirillum sp.]MDY5050965.1 hypothetical protein [Candidatus Mucispirillum faecigallinarum]